MDRVLDKVRRLKARKVRIRKKLTGVSQRPRVCVYFSNKNIIAQVIDDESGKTLASLSTLDKGAPAKGKNREAAKTIGAALADKALAAGVNSAVFDRNGALYHGKVKEFADAMREKGISM